MLDRFFLNGDWIPLNAVEIAEAGEGFVVVKVNEGTEYLNLLAPEKGEQIIKSGK
ncbi:MAG: hypothetical protein LCH52_03740 [Bacteroidetes bacterium]|nr:hypothetical protein [Bacteroidota bacterium]